MTIFLSLFLFLFLSPPFSSPPLLSLLFPSSLFSSLPLSLCVSLMALVWCLGYIWCKCWVKESEREQEVSCVQSGYPWLTLSRLRSSAVRQAFLGLLQSSVITLGEVNSDGNGGGEIKNSSHILGEPPKIMGWALFWIFLFACQIQPLPCRFLLWRLTSNNVIMQVSCPLTSIGFGQWENLQEEGEEPLPFLTRTVFPLQKAWAPARWPLSCTPITTTAQFPVRASFLTSCELRMKNFPALGGERGGDCHHLLLVDFKCVTHSVVSSQAPLFMEFSRQEYTIRFSKGSSQPKDWTWVSCIAGRFFIIWVTREALISNSLSLNFLSHPYFMFSLSWLWVIYANVFCLLPFDS